MARRQVYKNIAYAQLIALILTVSALVLYLNGGATGLAAFSPPQGRQLSFTASDDPTSPQQNVILYLGSEFRGNKWFESNIEITPETKYEMKFDLNYMQRTNFGSYGTIRFDAFDASGVQIYGGDIVMFNSTSAWPTIPSDTVVTKTGNAVSAIWQSLPDAATLKIMPDFYPANPEGVEADTYTITNFIVTPVA